MSDRLNWQNHFWSSFGYQSNSITKLLDDADCTVDQLLDDSDCLNQFKMRNRQLIEFFDHERILVLIDYITVVADEKDGANRGRKYPFLVDQIFSLELDSIIYKFFEAPPVNLQQAEPKNEQDEDEVEILDQDDDADKSEDEASKRETNDQLLNSEEKDTSIENQVVSSQVSESPNKYVLLDRLFKFIQTEENEELNSVLCSYFCKLVAILIRTNPKELTQYIFAPESNIIDRLMHHSYQKSISDLILWVLVRIGNTTDSKTIDNIYIAQKLAISKLVNALGPDHSMEHNLNAQALLEEMIRIKELNDMVCTKEQLSKIVDFASSIEQKSTKMSMLCSLHTLNSIVSNINILLRKSKVSQKNDSFDDEVIQLAHSDEEDVNKSDNPIIGQVDTLTIILNEKMPAISTKLSLDIDDSQRVLQVSDTYIVPLGQQRLHIVELITNLVLIPRDSLHKAMIDSLIFSRIMDLTQTFQWNNMLQVRVMILMERIISGTTITNETFRAQFLEQTQITKTLAQMGDSNTFELDSGRQIRNGYMGLVVKVSNLLIQKGQSEPAHQDNSSNDENQDTNSDKCQRTVSEFLNKKDNSDIWQSWIEGELQNSNELNNRKLGASKKIEPESEDEDSEGYPEENKNEFEKTSKLVQFSQIINSLKTKQNDQLDEDDQEEEDERDEDDEEEVDHDQMNVFIDSLQEEDIDEKEKEVDTSDSELSLNFDHNKKEEEIFEKVSEKQSEQSTQLSTELNNNFLDNTYWRIGAELEQSVDIDALIAELEGF